LLLIFPQGEDNWIAVNPPDPARYPGEVWYGKKALYYLVVQAGDISFITNNLLEASFVVRFSEEKGYWQLVEWRDEVLGHNEANSPHRSGRTRHEAGVR